jgi:LysM repeat protein
VVQAGDTLSEIAAHYGVTIEAIRQYNGITDNRRIYPGDVLLIPLSGTPIVNPLPPRQVHHGVYLVRHGDTLFEIAAAFNANIYDIAEANGILNLNSIFVGQRLHIPGY